MDKDLTDEKKVSKLYSYEQEMKKDRKTGRVVLIIDFNQGGVTNLQEFERIS